MGLRGKLFLAITMAFVLALGLSALLGWQAVGALRQQLGADFARNATLLAEQRILTPVARELALAQRFAASDVLRRWLIDEADPERKAAFEREAEGYRQDFSDRSYFVVSTASRQYYYADEQAPSIREPRYQVDPEAPKDAWFFASLRQTDDYNLNVDSDPALGVTKVWINVVTQDQGRKLAMSGTGLDLTALLKNFIAQAERGVTPMILNAAGAIQLHPDDRRIARGSGAGVGSADQTLFRLIDPADEDAARAALSAAKSDPAGVAMFSTRIDGREQLVTLSWLPELQWVVSSAVDLDVARVLDTRSLLPLGLAVLVLLVVLSGAFLVGINRLLISPLLRLEQSVQAVAGGNYALRLPMAAADEIGSLTRAFDHMAHTVQRHTQELESTVEARTRALVDANQAMKEAHDKIRSSIEYASLMQRSLLPDSALGERFGGRHAVLWLPRDVVGGDTYFFRERDGELLLGVVDCAGHGVPGAFMTMLAWAALDNAVESSGLRSPAALLQQMDAAVRALARPGAPSLSIATNMDAALVWIDPAGTRLRFAGAKLGLLAVSPEGTLSELRGERRTLGDRRPAVFTDTEQHYVPGTRLHLVTDGLPDQAGGDHGYGFGTTRLTDLLRRHAADSPAQQHAHLLEALRTWQGSRPQRDDITLLSVDI